MNATKLGTLFLVPNTLADGTAALIVNAQIQAVANNTQYFIAEHAKTARRFLKEINTTQPLQSLIISELNQHTPTADLQNLLKPALLHAHDIALISDAGCPAIADPGALVVAQAHRLGIQVVPLVGASSIILALMASGANGQHFAFGGYLPIDKNQQRKRLIELETLAQKHQQSQIFIETPYRNNQLISTILTTCKPNTMLCIAANLTATNEFIKTATISQWQKNPPPDLHKQPTVFVLF
jgi:16S rRNA (cytidine1402-2'-O)-methyltransferase